MPSPRYPTRKAIYRDIDDERERQRMTWGHAHDWGRGDCASPDVDMMVKVAVLTEEVGEVARAVLDKDPANLRDELVQVAAVAIAILEGIDGER